jgi:5-methylcytosine-specific restriction endonuclease McrA
MGYFSQDTISAVWRKAMRASCFLARDTQGNLIARRQYGQQTELGWEIDHILPTYLGGRDDIGNLQPLHWRANRQKGASIDPLSLVFLGK